MYINVIVENHYADVFVRVEKMGSIKDEKRQRFEIQNGELSDEAAHFIERYERKSPFSYISLLNPLKHQGAAKGCDGIGMQPNVWLCAGGKKRQWSVYVDAAQLQGLQKRFKKTGLDFIFSPFSLLRSSFTKESNAPDAKLFILILEKNMSVAIFKKGVLEFAKQISIESDPTDFDLDHDDELLLDEDDLIEDENDSLDLDLDINLDEAETKDEASGALDGLEGLESLDDLEDLESLEGLDELDSLDDIQELEDINELTPNEELEAFTEAEDESEQSPLVDEEKEKADLSGLSRNYKRFELIQEAIHDFYSNSDIQSSFIEEVFLLDQYSDAKDLKGYLEDELFVEVTVPKINAQDILLGLAKSEAKDAS